jgi:hypothetical protein
MPCTPARPSKVALPQACRAACLPGAASLPCQASPISTSMCLPCCRRFRPMRKKIAAVIFDSGPTSGTSTFEAMAEAYRGAYEALVGSLLRAAELLLRFTPVGWGRRFW